MVDQNNLPSIGIIVLNWNGKALTTKCLSSLGSIRYPNLEIIVVDNGSVDGSLSHLQAHFPHCIFIEAKENLGYAGGNNLGIEYGLNRGLDFFLILNNDTEVAPDILDAYLQAFDQTPKAGILGGRIYLMDEPKRLDHLGGTWNQKRLDFDYVGHRQLDNETNNHPQKIDYVCGAAMMVKRIVFETMGMFDPRFFLFWEESDLCFRAREGGFLVLTCPGAWVWHKVSASLCGGKPHGSYFLSRNRLLWIERNLKGLRRLEAFAKILLLELSALYGSRFLRQMQKLFQKNGGRNLERQVRITAKIWGIEDYLLRRFGLGRSKKFMNCH